MPYFAQSKERQGGVVDLYGWPIKLTARSDFSFIVRVKCLLYLCADLEM